MTYQNLSVSDFREQKFECIFTKNGVAQDVDASSLRLDIYDSEGTLRGSYSLTSNPAIEYTESTKSYHITIEVTNYPDGDITAEWFANIEGTACHDLDHTDRVVITYEFEADDLVVRIGDYALQAATTTFKQDVVNVVGPYRVRDETGSPYSPYSVRVQIKDYNNNEVETVTLTEVLADGIQTGIYQGSWTPDSSTVELGIYILQPQHLPRVTDTDWLALDSWRQIQVVARPEVAYVDKNFQASFKDVYTICPRIEEYLGRDVSQARRETILLDALQMAHNQIYSKVGPMGYKYSLELIRETEALYAVYLVLRSNVGIEEAVLKRFREDCDKNLDTIARRLGIGSGSMCGM